MEDQKSVEEALKRTIDDLRRADERRKDQLEKLQEEERHWRDTVGYSLNLNRNLI